MERTHLVTLEISSNTSIEGNSSQPERPKMKLFCKGKLALNRPTPTIPLLKEFKDESKGKNSKNLGHNAALNDTFSFKSQVNTNTNSSAKIDDFDI